MSSQALIRLDWQSQHAAMTAEAEKLKVEALESAGMIGKVTNPETQENAVQAQRKLADIKSLCEKARKAAKAPALDFGRRIDAAAEEFIRDVDDELARISTTIGDYQQLELAKQRAAEQARIAEERRIEEERRQAELAAIRAAEVERQKLAAQERELARQAAEARSKREKELLAQQQVEIDRQKALAAAKSHEEMDRIQEQHSNAMAAVADRPKYEPARATGQRVVEDWDVQVSDIHLLYRAHPSCVKVEPIMSEIKSLLKAGVSVKGVIAKPIVRAGTTRSKYPDAIEV